MGKWWRREWRGDVGESLVPGSSGMVRMKLMVLLCMEVEARSAVHESPTTGLPIAKKKRRNEEGQDRDGGRRRYSGDEVNAFLIKQSASVSPVVIDLDLIRTPPSLPFDFDFERIVDMDLNLNLLSEVDWQHIPPPPDHLNGWMPPSSTSLPSSFLSS